MKGTRKHSLFHSPSSCKNLNLASKKNRLRHLKSSNKFVKCPFPKQTHEKQTKPEQGGKYFAGHQYYMFDAFENKNFTPNEYCPINSNQRRSSHYSIDELKGGKIRQSFNLNLFMTKGKNVYEEGDFFHKKTQNNRLNSMQNQLEMLKKIKSGRDEKLSKVSSSKNFSSKFYEDQLAKVYKRSKMVMLEYRKNLMISENSRIRLIEENKQLKQQLQRHKNKLICSSTTIGCEILFDEKH